MKRAVLFCLTFKLKKWKFEDSNYLSTIFISCFKNIFRVIKVAKKTHIFYMFAMRSHAYIWVVMNWPDPCPITPCDSVSSPDNSIHFIFTYLVLLFFFLFNMFCCKAFHPALYAVIVRCVSTEYHKRVKETPAEWTKWLCADQFLCETSPAIERHTQNICSTEQFPFFSADGCVDR